MAPTGLIGLTSNLLEIPFLAPFSLEPLKDVAPKKLIFLMPTFYKEHTFSKCISHYQAPDLSRDHPCLAANLRIGIYNGEMVFSR